MRTINESINGIPERIEKWLRIALVKRAFSGQPDNVLRPIRNIIKENKKGFPFDTIVNHFKGTNKSFTFAEEDIENLLFSKYGRAHTFSVLALLYPTLDYRHRFHIDHVFPRSFFTKSQLRKRGIPESKREFYLDNHDLLGNLQVLEGLPNEEKSNKDFETWLKEAYPDEQSRKDYMKKHFIQDDIDLSFGNFEQFFEERNKLILNRLREVLT